MNDCVPTTEHNIPATPSAAPSEALSGHTESEATSVPAASKKPRRARPEGNKKRTALSKLKKDEEDFSNPDAIPSVLNPANVTSVSLPENTAPKAPQPFSSQTDQKAVAKSATPLGQIYTAEPPLPTETPTEIFGSTLNPEPTNYEQLEKDLQNNELRQARIERRHKQRMMVWNKVKIIATITACFYLLFLIFGALNTSYVYNEKGRVEPLKLSYAQLKERNDFEKVENEYLQARRLYEEILTLDYRLAAGIEDPILLSVEYEKLLDKQIEPLTIQVKALNNKDAKYTQFISMLTAWISVDAAVYCQNMSEAIAKNNSTAANHAIQYRNQMYSDFSIITSTISTLGGTVYGVSTDDIEAWSPEGFINSKYGAGGVENGN